MRLAQVTHLKRWGMLVLLPDNTLLQLALHGLCCRSRCQYVADATLLLLPTSMMDCGCVNGLRGLLLLLLLTPLRKFAKLADDTRTSACSLGMSCSRVLKGRHLAALSMMVCRSGMHADAKSINDGGAGGGTIAAGAAVYARSSCSSEVPGSMVSNNPKQ